MPDRLRSFDWDGRDGWDMGRDDNSVRQQQRGAEEVTKSWWSVASFQEMSVRDGSLGG